MALKCLIKGERACDFSSFELYMKEFLAICGKLHGDWNKFSYAKTIEASKNIQAEHFEFCSISYGDMKIC